MKTFKIDHSQKLHFIFRNDLPILNHILYDNGFYVVTDGRILAKIPADNGDGQYLIPTYVYKEALKLKADEITLDENKKQWLINHKKGQTAFPYDPDIKVIAYPDYAKVIPDYNKTKTITIGLDANLLKKLADISGRERLHLEINISDNEKPILVYPAYGEEFTGLIMPLKVY